MGGVSSSLQLSHLMLTSKRGKYCVSDCCVTILNIGSTVCDICK